MKAQGPNHWTGREFPRNYILFIFFCYLVARSSYSFVTPWISAHQAPLSVGFLRQEYWSGLSFPSPEDLLNPGMEPTFPALTDGFFTTEPSTLNYSCLHVKDGKSLIKATDTLKFFLTYFSTRVLVITTE